MTRVFWRGFARGSAAVYVPAAIIVPFVGAVPVSVDIAIAACAMLVVAMCLALRK